MSCRGPFTDVVVRTAKCSECDQRNRNTLKKCVECGEQLCRACFGRSNGLHGPLDATPAFTTFPPPANSSATPVIPPSTHAPPQSLPTQTASTPTGTPPPPVARPLSSPNAQNTPVHCVGSSGGSSTAIVESISPPDHAHGRATLTQNPPTPRPSAPTDHSPPRRQSLRIQPRSSDRIVVDTTEAPTGDPHSSSNDTPAGSTALPVNDAPYPSTRRLRSRKATAPKLIPVELAMQNSSPRDSAFDTAFLNDGSSPSITKGRRHGRAHGPKQLTAAQAQKDLNEMLPLDAHKNARSVEASQSSNFPSHFFESPTAGQVRVEQAANPPKPQTTTPSRNIDTGASGFSLRQRTRTPPAIMVTSDSEKSDTDSHIWNRQIITGHRAPAATPASGTAHLPRTQPILSVALQRLAADNSGSGPMEVDAVDQIMSDVADEQPENPASHRRSQRLRTAVATYNDKEAAGTHIHTPSKYLNGTLPGRVKRKTSPLASEVAGSDEQMGDVQMEDVQMQDPIDGAIERAKASDIGTPVDAAYIEKGLSSKQVRFAREKESATTSRRHTTDRSAVLSPKFSSEHPPKADSEESDPELESEAEVYNPLRTRSGRAPGRISGLEAKQVIADQVVPSRLGARNSKKEDKEDDFPGRQTRELNTYLETIKLPKSWYESQKKVDRKPRHSALGLLDGDLRPVLRDDVHPISQNDLPRNLRWNDPRNNGGPRNASKTAKKMKGNALDEILGEAEYKFKSRAPPTPPSEPYPESRATYKFLNAKDEQLVSPSSLDRKKSNVRAKTPSSVRASSANVPGQASSSGLSSTHNPPGANEAKLQRNLSNLYSGFENDEEEIQDDTIDAFYRPNHSAPPKRRRVDGRYSEERESEATTVPDTLSSQPSSSKHGSAKRKIKGKDWWTSMFDTTEARRRPAVEASRNASGFPTIPRATGPAKPSRRPRRTAQRAGGRFGAPTVLGANMGTAPGDRQRAFAAPPRRPVYAAPHVTFQPAQGFAHHPPGILHEAHAHQHPPEETQAFQGSNNHPRPAPGTMNAPQLPPQNNPGYAPLGYAPPAGAQQAQGLANYPLPHGAGMASASQIRSHTEPPEFAPGFAHGSANGWPGSWN